MIPLVVLGQRSHPHLIRLVKISSFVSVGTTQTGQCVNSHMNRRISTVLLNTAVSPALTCCKEANLSGRFVKAVPSSSATWLTTRFYGTKKDKKKGKGKTKTYSDVYVQEMNEVIDVEAMRSEMQHVLDILKEDFVTQLTVRTSAASFENIRVKTDRGVVPLNQLGQVIQKNPQMIHIDMISSPQFTKQAMTAINSAGMNVNPQQEGTSIFIPLPKVTREHREKLAAAAKKLYNDSKNPLNKVKQKYDKKVDKEKHISSDLIYKVHQFILDETKSYQTEGKSMMEAVQKDLLQEKL